MGFGRLYTGLHIGSRHLALAVLERRKSILHLREARVMKLRPGLIQPSPSKPNISDLTEFESNIQRLLDSCKGLSTLSLGIPDPSIRAALLSQNNQQVKGRDLDNLIRWQMEKIFLSPLGDSRVVHQSVPSSNRHVLAVTIQSQILKQYEDSIRKLGIEPICVNVSSFQLFNLYHDLLLQQAGTSGRFIVLNLFDDNYTLMIFVDGAIDFIRVKALKSPSAGDEIIRSDDSSWSDSIMHELNASISFYGQKNDPSLISHLFVCGRGMSEFIKKAYDQYQIEVEPLEPQRVAYLGGLAKVRLEEIPLVIPAIAAATDGVIQFLSARRLASTPKVLPSVSGEVETSQVTERVQDTPSNGMVNANVVLPSSQGAIDNVGPEPAEEVVAGEVDTDRSGVEVSPSQTVADGVETSQVTERVQDTPSNGMVNANVVLPSSQDAIDNVGPEPAEEVVAGEVDTDRSGVKDLLGQKPADGIETNRVTETVQRVHNEGAANTSVAISAKQDMKNRGEPGSGKEGVTGEVDGFRINEAGIVEVSPEFKEFCETVALIARRVFRNQWPSVKSESP